MRFMKTKIMYRQLLRLGAVIAAAALTMLLMEGSVSGRSLYYIKNDGRTRIAYTSLTDPKEILLEAGRELGEFDYYKVEPRPGDDDAYFLYVMHGRPVYINVDGSQKMAVLEEGQNFADALKTAGVTLGPEDIVSEELTVQPEFGAELTIQRVTYETRSETEVISYETEYERTRYMAEGKSVQYQSGKDGVKTIYYTDKLIDGVVVETAVTGEEITLRPQNAVSQIGDADAPDRLETPASLKLDEKGNPVSYTKVLTGKATAYSASVGARGASGRYLQTGYVAVDPDVIPYGSRLYIKSSDGSYVYGYAIAADTGTALVDGRVLVDVYFNSYAEACKFGAKKVDVYVLS